jgi:uncharacterized protein YciI
MFVIILNYIKSLEEIDKYIPSHIEFLDEQYKKGLFFASGAKIPRTGGVILASGNDKESLHKILEQDPFYIANVAQYEVIEFNPSKMHESFGRFTSVEIQQ